MKIKHRYVQLYRFGTNGLTTCTRNHQVKQLLARPSKRSSTANGDVQTATDLGEVSTFLSSFGLAGIAVSLTLRMERIYSCTVKTKGTIGWAAAILLWKFLWLIFARGASVISFCELKEKNLCKIKLFQISRGDEISTSPGKTHTRWLTFDPLMPWVQKIKISKFNFKWLFWLNLWRK